MQGQAYTQNTQHNNIDSVDCQFCCLLTIHVDGVVARLREAILRVTSSIHPSFSLQHFLYGLVDEHVLCLRGERVVGISMSYSQQYK